MLNVRGWGRGETEGERGRETKGQTGIKWMRTHAMLGCYSAGIRFHAYPKGSDRFTNGHGDNWSLRCYWNTSGCQTHTHTHTDVQILFPDWMHARHVHTLIYSTYTIYSCILTSVQSKNKRRTQCAVSVYTPWNLTHMREISKAIKHFLVAGWLHLDTVRT